MHRGGRARRGARPQALTVASSAITAMGDLADLAVGLDPGLASAIGAGVLLAG